MAAYCNPDAHDWTLSAQQPEGYEEHTCTLCGCVQGVRVATAAEFEAAYDAVTKPKHYTGHPSGIECIQITEHMGFNLGNAVKYIWRCDLKADAIEDLEKAAWYVQREIARRKAAR